MRKDLLKSITALCTKQRTLQDELAELELKAKQKKEQLDKISRIDIPELMEEAELASFTFDDGTVVEIRHEFACSISEDRKGVAFDWLRKHGFGGLIKTSVVASFGRDEDDKALKLAADLTKKKFVTKLIEVVHPQTLKAFIREQREKGKVVPDATFGIYNYNETKITRQEKRP